MYPFMTTSHISARIARCHVSKILGKSTSDIENVRQRVENLSEMASNNPSRASHSEIKYEDPNLTESRIGDRLASNSI